jgi:hypothetical protein
MALITSSPFPSPHHAFLALLAFFFALSIELLKYHVPGLSRKVQRPYSLAYFITVQAKCGSARCRVLDRV